MRSFGPGAPLRLLAALLACQLLASLFCLPASPASSPRAAVTGEESLGRGGQAGDSDEGPAFGEAHCDCTEGIPCAVGSASGPVGPTGRARTSPPDGAPSPWYDVPAPIPIPG